MCVRMPRQTCARLIVEPFADATEGAWLLGLPGLIHGGECSTSPRPAGSTQGVKTSSLAQCVGSALVQRRESQQISVRFLRRDPPAKHHPTRARHGEQIATPRRLRGVGGQRAVGAVIGNEFL